MKEVLGIIALAVFVSGCQSVGPNTAGGGAFGGLAGGLAGAAIGATEGKAPEGALIGALAGGTVGSLAGAAVDRDVQRDRFAYQQFQNQQVQGAVTIDQVVRMTQSGLGSSVIARQISSLGIVRRPNIDELILLKNQGVDDLVIQAIQSAPVAGRAAPVRYVERRSPPVFVESYSYHHPHHYVHPRRCHGPRSSSVGFSFGF